MSQFSTLTLEELTKKKSTIKSILIAFMVLAVLIILLLAYLYFVKGRHLKIATLIPIFILPVTWIPIIVSLKSIDAEIKIRKANNNQ